MSAVAERYAAALADVVMERKGAPDIPEGLVQFVDLFFSSADLRNALESPAVDREVKIKIVDEVAEKMKLNDAVRNFICVVVDNRRTHMLREIVELLSVELNRRQHIVKLEVTSARKLDEGERKRLIEVFKGDDPKRKVGASFAEDETLLGGVVVRVGSTVYDGSVREQLNRLRERLESE
ncbi:MAG: ATP synthase F1 subunit delta [Candidatus Acidiferrales bacterium]